MPESVSRPRTSAPATPEVDSVVEATRVIGALIAESLAALEPAITVPQWRVLVLASRGGCNVSAVATDLGVHPSNATRICDRLVSADLLRRRRDEADRRSVRLELTAAGHRLYDSAMRTRRRRVQRAMGRLSATQRTALAETMAVFAEALTDEHDEHLRPYYP